MIRCVCPVKDSNHSTTKINIDYFASMFPDVLSGRLFSPNRWFFIIISIQKHDLNDKND